MISMRSFSKGRPFMDVEADTRNEDDGLLHPVFSEAFLYERVGKDDARFILAVAGEYEHLIKKFGHEQIKAWLEEKSDGATS